MLPSLAPTDTASSTLLYSDTYIIDVSYYVSPAPRSSCELINIKISCQRQECLNILAELYLLDLLLFGKDITELETYISQNSSNPMFSWLYKNYSIARDNAPEQNLLCLYKSKPHINSIEVHYIDKAGQQFNTTFTTSILELIEDMVYTFATQSRGEYEGERAIWATMNKVKAWAISICEKQRLEQTLALNETLLSKHKI